MKAPTPEEIKEAVAVAKSYVSTPPHHPLEYTAKNAVSMVITALKAEQERLDWVFENCTLHFNVVGRMPTRERIDQLRNPTKP